GARRPFGRDTASLDYDVDSDAEWEAEEEGEDLQSEDDDEDEDSDDDADDDDFDEQHSFVVGDRMPHSELGDQSLSEDGESGDESDTDEASNFNSEDEVMEEIDSSEEVCDNGMDVDDTTEPISSRRKKAGAFASISSIDPAGPNTNFASARSRSHTHDEKKRDHPPSRRAKVLPLTPVVIGLIWNRDSTTATILGALDALTVRAVGSALPLSVSVAAHDVQPAQPTARTILGKCEGTAGALARKSRDVTDADLHSLVGVVHGSSFGIARLVELLRPLIAGASKALIERLIHEHAVKEKRPPATRSMWYVKEQLVEQARTYQQRSGSSVISPIAHVSVSDGSEAEESAAKRQRVGEVIGRSRRPKNPLEASKDQVDNSSEVIFPGPFNSAYSTVDTIPLDQAEEDYRQVLKRIRECRSDIIIIGKRSTDMPQTATEAIDVEVVDASQDSASFHSSD
ncbi:hypothetical protein GGI24_002545, partial [Coemansia furcata]